MKNTRREFCKMMAAGIAGAILPVGTVNAKQKAGPLDDRAAAYNTGRNGGFLSVDLVRDKEQINIIEAQKFTVGEVTRKFNIPSHLLRSQIVNNK